MASIYKELMVEGFYNFNYNNLKGVKLTEGYMVSFKDYAKLPVCNDEEGDLIFDKMVFMAILELQKECADNDEMFVGVWEHEGLCYIDFSARLMNREIAVSLGKTLKQVAIYDLNNGVEIFL